MMSKVNWLCIALIASAEFVVAAPPAGSPIDALLFSPEAILGNRAPLGLSSKQVARMQQQLEEAASKGQELQRQADEAMAQLVRLLSANIVDEEATLQQLDEILSVEKAQRRLHLRVMVRIRNELTAQQRQAAAKMKLVPASFQDRQDRLKRKLAQIQQVMQNANYRRSATAGGRPDDARISRVDAEWADG